jgi:hypothetical protein
VANPSPEAPPETTAWIFSKRMEAVPWGWRDGYFTGNPRL